MAPDKPFQLQVLTKKHLGQVAEIHQKAFPESYLSKIGPKAIIKYYDWHMQPPNICTATGTFRKDHLIGFSFAGVFRNAELFFLKDNFLFFLGVFLSRPTLFFNPEIKARLRKAITYLREYLPLKQKNRVKDHGVKSARFGILSIAVDPQAQGSGIGRALMNEVERSALEAGFQKIELSVRPSNIQALSFYEKLGWKKVFYDQSQPWQGYMHKELEN